MEGARAALPLLAFAVSRLWEKRDREKKLLTRAAYKEIGGVAWAFWLRVWDLASGTSRLLRPCRKFPPNGFGPLQAPTLAWSCASIRRRSKGSVSSLSVFDLASRSTREITSHGNRLTSFALDAPARSS